MFAWSHTTTPFIAGPITVQGVKEAYNVWSLKTLAFQRWSKHDASGLRILIAFSLMVIADLTTTPPPDIVVSGRLVTPAIDDSTTFATHFNQRLAGAILHTWRVLWAVTGTPADGPRLLKSVATVDGGEATSYMGDAGWLPSHVGTLISTGDLGAVCALAQFAPQFLERSAASEDDTKKPFKDQVCTCLGRVAAIVAAHYSGGSDVYLETLRKAALEDNMRLLQLAPRQNAPLPDDGPLPVPSPEPQPLPLPIPEEPSNPSGGGGLFALLLAAYFFLET